MRGGGNICYNSRLRNAQNCAFRENMIQIFKKYGKKYKKRAKSLRKGLDRDNAEQYNDEVCVKVHFIFMHISNKTFSATTF